MNPDSFHQLHLVGGMCLAVILGAVVIWRLGRRRASAFPAPRRSGITQLPDRESQLRQRAIWLAQLRWIAAAVVLVLAVIAVPISKLLPLSSLPPLLGWWLVLVVSNAVFSRRLDRTRNPELLMAIQIVIDLVVVSGLLNASGGVENPLYFAYVFPVIVGATLFWHGSTRA